NEEVPIVRFELYAIISDAHDLGATAGVVEPQLAGSSVEPPHDPIRQDSAERPRHPRHDYAHLERWGLRRVEDALSDCVVLLIRSRHKPHEPDKTGNQSQRDDDQRRLLESFHFTPDQRRLWRWS